MTTVRNHITALEDTDDLTRIKQRVHWADHVPAVAALAASENGPAILFEDSGETRLVSGAYGGPDQMHPRERTPWSRLAMALSCDSDIPYEQLLSAVSDALSTNSIPSHESLVAEYRDVDPHSLGLPAVGTDTAPGVTLGLLVVSIGDETETTWAPLRGRVHGSDTLRSSVPTALAESLSQGTDVTVALGVPVACLVAAALRWGGQGVADPIPTAGALDTLSVADARGGLVPASAEVTFDGTVAAIGENPPGMAESWEHTTATTSIEIQITDIALREDPMIPFTPLGAPLADDLHLTGLIEASRLFHRVNNYWGVAPVEWIALPVETKLGMCLVASDVLYAGFEWQLANTLFSFSRLFDKILILDADTSPENLARAFDDMWVKAHPSHDWQFSDPAAPAATATAYRRNGTTGSRLYINATWDPRWDEEYIPPQVNFETSFPPDVRAFVYENWNDMGFHTDLQEE
jgi:UbiD family decarboxylase